MVQHQRSHTCSHLSLLLRRWQVCPGWASSTRGRKHQSFHQHGSIWQEFRLALALKGMSQIGYHEKATQNRQPWTMAMPVIHFDEKPKPLIWWVRSLRGKNETKEGGNKEMRELQQRKKKVNNGNNQKNAHITKDRMRTHSIWILPVPKSSKWRRKRA